MAKKAADVLGPPIIWSEMDGDVDEIFLEMATLSQEDIELAISEMVPELRAFLEAELLEEEDIIGPAQV